MSEENITQKFTPKNIDKIRNYLIEEINQNELISKKHKTVYRNLNYMEHSLILISTIIGCVFISDFAFLVGVSVGITSSAIEALAKFKLDSVRLLISKTLIHVLINNLPKEFDDMKEEIKNSNDK